jgi:hypothetical protein
MQRRVKRRSQGKRKLVSYPSQNSQALQPPPFLPTVKTEHKFRFTSGSMTGSNVMITRKQILNLLLMATSATTTVRLFQAVRLKRVRMWSNPTALGQPPDACQLEWLGENSPSTVISDSSMGVRPAHVNSLPPPSASNRWWSISGQLESDVLFALTFPANTIVDVTVSARLVEQESPTAGDIPAGASLGQLYGDYLDGITSSILSPIGLNQLP